MMVELEAWETFLIVDAVHTLVCQDFWRIELISGYSNDHFRPHKYTAHLRN